MTKKASRAVTIERVTNKKQLKKLLNVALNEPLRTKKGYKFEFFFENLMKREKQFRIVDKHSRSRLGEVDYIYRNEYRGSFWHQFSHVCVECKNWKKKIASKEMDHLISLIKDKSPLSCLGVFVTNTRFEESAKTSMKNARIGDKILVVPFEGENLESMIELDFKDSVIKRCEESVFKKKFS